MTDKANAGRRSLDEVPGYESHRLPIDPWGRQVAHLCTRCGVWVGDTVAHDMDHSDRETITAPLIVERIAKPQDLRALADQLRAHTPPPWAGMDPGTYTVSTAMHALADALTMLAGPPITDVAHAPVDITKDPDAQP